MFLALGGLWTAAQAAEPASGDYSGYYSSGTSGTASFTISDEDESTSAAASSAAASSAPAATRVEAQSRAEQNALYVDGGAEGYGHEQVGYYSGGGGSCGCSSGCGGGCGDCGSGNWACGNGCDCAVNSFRFEYLAWFTRGRNTPPLVTTGTQASEGVLGDPDTQILFGGDSAIEDGLRSGGRVTFSHLFNDGRTYGDVRFWGLEDGSSTFGRTSGGDPILAVPFFNAALGVNDSLLVAFPGVSAPGSVSVRSKNDIIAADAWLRRNLYDDCCDRVDLLAGYMFTRLDDTLSINTELLAVGGPVPPAGTVLSTSDSFRTQNEFHGAQFGFLAEAYRGNWSVELLGKIAIGDMRQAVIVNGSTTTTQPGGPATTGTGGLFALPTNSGSFDRHRVAFVPEINLNLIYNINPCWRVIGGYSFVYWSNVVLAGNQIDPNLNFTQIPGPIAGPIAPQTTFTRTDYWAQGLSLGAEYRW
jgi:hypothetical protein